MSHWRVIITNSESLTGVAPTCENHVGDVAAVYDCCPGPHIECWSEQHAEAIAKALTETGAEICS